MMNQFEAWSLNGKRTLFVVDTSRYDFMIGFRRIIKEL
jgi:hypothetical protein